MISLLNVSTQVKYEMIEKQNFACSKPVLFEILEKYTIIYLNGQAKRP